MLLELGLSLNFKLSFSSLTFHQGLIPQEGITFQLENGQLKGLLIVALIEFNNPLNGLNPIDVAFRLQVTIKIWYLNLEVTKIISKWTSPFNTSLLIVFMRRRVGNINSVVLKLLAVRSSALGSFNPLRLQAKLS